ncbi:MAG: histidine--tRNA ligase [Acidobacteria bacterium]|nr:histidine--tRNA ligase [Acidobacteriota bacterium]
MIHRIKGTQDLLPGEIEKWQYLEQKARDIFARYGYMEIRTPIFEETELFVRSIGQETDIVQKEMYTFADKSKKSLTLRPEGTAPVVRACIENNLLAGSGTLKLFYMGPMFRYERPQKGRYRQFYQIGAEVLGPDNPLIDVEVMEMLVRFLEELEIHPYQLHINSIGCPGCRPKYLKVLRAEITHALPQLCADCNRRASTNPLRVLDCKVETDQAHINALPASLDYLCEDCRTHFAVVQRFLNNRDIHYSVNSRLVRGLDYYEKTTFEITSDLLGAQNALLGGGRYNGLSESLGGPAISGFGFALGEERFILALPKEDYFWMRPEVYLAPLGPACFDFAVTLASQLRRNEIRAFLEFGDKSLKSQLRHADKLRIPFALIFGTEELHRKEIQCKNMRDGTQVTIRAEVSEIIRAIRGDTAR